MKLRHMKTGRRLMVGFTLIEILAALSIFLVIGLMVSTSIQAIWVASASSSKRLDNYGRARYSINLIHRDIKSVVERGPHLGFEILSNNGDDLYIYTTQSGNVPSGGGIAQSDRNLSYVAYEVNSSASDLNERGLRRFERGFDYQGSLRLFSSTPPTLNPDLYPSGDGFLVGPGVLVVKFQGLDSAGDPAVLSQDSQTLIVSILVLDELDLRQSSGNANFDSIISGMQGGVLAAGASYGETWQQQLDDPVFLDQLTPQLRKGLRVFQVYLPLDR
ncbi:MAG: prepilin-type N-terminal cleavage/methylation domain-containing protein [Verrucomicrobiota bacterium]